jgi:hypothetical protein
VLTRHLLSRSRDAPFAGMSNGPASPLKLPPPLLRRRASAPPDDEDSIPARARWRSREPPTKTLNPGVANPRHRLRLYGMAAARSRRVEGSRRGAFWRGLQVLEWAACCGHKGSASTVNPEPRVAVRLHFLPLQVCCCCSSITTDYCAN